MSVLKLWISMISAARTQTAVIMGLDEAVRFVKKNKNNRYREVLLKFLLFSDESTTREDEELVRKYSEKITRQTNVTTVQSNKKQVKNFLTKSRSNLPVSFLKLDLNFFKIFF